MLDSEFEQLSQLSSKDTARELFIRQREQNIYTSKIKKSNKDLFFLQLAEVTATRSKDPRTQVGAIVVTRDGRQMSLGYNGFPKGFPDISEYWETEKKHQFVIHAEINCLLNCPFDTPGCTLYCTHKPCVNCLKAIINSGIVRIVYLNKPEWEENHFCEDQETLLQYFQDLIGEIDVY